MKNKITWKTHPKSCFGTLIGIILLYYGCSKIPETPKTTEQLAKEATYAPIESCKKAIIDIINDPDSVKFEEDKELAVKNGKRKGSWGVHIPLRAKNSFNATIKSAFICRVECNSETCYTAAIAQE